jgi:DNA-binding NarL/FixJ family response regulator
MTAIRTLLVDDNATILDCVEKYVSTLPGIEVIGRAQSAGQAINMVAQLCPDLVLMDVTMPDMNGLEATRQIKRLNLSPRVIMLSIHDQAEYREAARSAQADAYISKGDLCPLLSLTVQELFQARSPSACQTTQANPPPQADNAKAFLL